MAVEYPVLAIIHNGEYAAVNARLLLPGTSEHQRLSLGVCGPLVEFFDMTSSATVYGQRISSYTLDALVDARGSINLFMSEPSWRLTAAARQQVVEWALSIVKTA